MTWSGGPISWMRLVWKKATASNEPIGGKSSVTAHRSFPELMMSSSLSALAGSEQHEPRCSQDSLSFRHVAPPVN
jgi:hypothetical protein